jgi:hypothetical protein
LKGFWKMARLTTKARKSLPKDDFAEPGKRSRSGGKGGYPIEDKTHARDALSRVSANGTAQEKAEVKRKVAEKFPGIGIGGKKKTGERDRGRGTESRTREGRR